MRFLLLTRQRVLAVVATVQQLGVRVKGALQLLSKSYMSNRFAQVPERISVSSSDGDHQRCILDLPRKPGTIRNK